MAKNTYTVSVTRTIAEETHYFVPRTDSGWGGHDMQFRQAPHSRPSPIEPETIEAHFQRVLNRLKTIEERRVSRSTSPGCWYNPTTPSPFAATAAAGPQESRALWLLNNCQATREIELRMIEAHRIREEAESRLQGGWNMPTPARQSIEWPAPPPPPRPYSPSPTPWMEFSSAHSTPHATQVETERRDQGIPVRISRAERRLRDQSSMPSSAQGPAPTSMDACIRTVSGPTLPPLHHWDASPSSLDVSRKDNVISAGAPTGDLLPSTLPRAVSQMDACPAWPPMPDNTIGQHGSAGRLRTTVDWRLGRPHELRGPNYSSSPSDGGRTIGARSPMSEDLHTPDREEVMPWSERRVNYGFGTWVIRGPSDQHICSHLRPSAFPAPESATYHHGTGALPYDDSTRTSQPAWGYIQPEDDERVRRNRKELAMQQVRVATGLWEAMGR